MFASSRGKQYHKISQSIFFVTEDAFLFSEEYFQAMCVCLQAVEENKASLLAEIDPKLVQYIHYANMPICNIQFSRL